MDISKELEAFVGSFVRVSICKNNFTRSSFDPQMSVSGTLEKHPDRDEYRVLVDDNNYTYFTSSDVVACSPRAIDGKFPTAHTIYLDITPDQGYQSIVDVEYSLERVVRALGGDYAKLVPMLRKKWEELY